MNSVDAAIAEVTASLAAKANLRTIKGLGKLAGLGPAFVDEGTPVAKVGRTTNLTRGRVTAFELDNVVVQYDLGNLRFDDQIEIEGSGAAAFSAGGDVGGSNGQGLTYANPIHTVLDKLKIDLA